MFESDFEHEKIKYVIVIVRLSPIIPVGVSKR